MANQYSASNSWPPERVERLKQLVQEGYSAGWIAADLGEITRNAVIGKVTRLGMRLGNSRNSMQKSTAAKLRLKARNIRAKTARLKAPIKTKFPVEALPSPHIEDIPRKKLADLGDNECRFGVGDPRKNGFGFCALECAPGRPYCPSHAARCYQTVAVRNPVLTITTDTSAPSKERETA